MVKLGKYFGDFNFHGIANYSEILRKLDDVKNSHFTISNISLSPEIYYISSTLPNETKGAPQASEQLGASARSGL